jgi:hypothetical protein
MSKKSLKWHKDSLANMQTHRGRLSQDLIRLKDEIKRLDNEINLYDSQIVAAELQGLDEFDSDKFWIKNKK